MKMLLAVLYGLCILPAHALGRLLGRDNLLLRRPRRDSYWIAKAPPGSVEAYFSQGSPRHGNGTTSDTPAPMAGWVVPLFVRVSRAFARPRRATETATSAASREHGIPDEIYTLW